MNGTTVDSLVSSSLLNAQSNKQTWGTLLYNVMAYGAKGDGVADDTAAIQKAVSAASSSGGTVFFPGGTYLVNQQILISSNNVKLLGTSQYVSIIKPANGFNITPGTNIVTFSNVSNCGVEKLQVQGVSSLFGTTQVIGITFYKCNEPFIIDSFVTDTSGIAVQLSNCNHANIEGNEISYTRNAQCGLWCGGTDQAGYAQATHRVISNHIHDCELDGIIFNAPGGVIADNDLHGNGAGATSTGAGIYVNVDSGSYAITITGNNIAQNDGNGIDAFGTGSSSGYGRAIISGNVCHHNNYAGILCGLKNASISGNTCYSNGLSPSIDTTQDSGIVLSAGAQNCSVVGNTAFDDQATKTQTYGIRTISGNNNNLIVGNDFNNNKTAPFGLVAGYQNVIRSNSPSYISFNLGASAVLSVADNSHTFILMVTNISDSTYARFLLKPNNIAYKLEDPYNGFDTAGAANLTNVLWDSASSTYQIKNSFSVTKFYTYIIEPIS